MVGNYKSITLCESTWFKDAFMERQKRQTLDGNVVTYVLSLRSFSDNESGLKIPRRC